MKRVFIGKPKFKVGDRVRIKKLPSTANHLWGVSGTISKIVVKEEPNINEIWCDNWSDNDSGYMYQNDIEKIN